MPRMAYPAPQPDPEPNPLAVHNCRIIGDREIFGHAPGTTAEIEATPSQLDVLIKAGLVEVVAAQVETDSTAIEKENGDGQVGSEELPDRGQRGELLGPRELGRGAAQEGKR